MAIDPYALCPGGRNKKIRFCCSDMIKELEQIQKFFNDDQLSACYSYIEEVEKKHPDCACLEAAKLEILKQQGRWEEMRTFAEKFYKREPNNLTAVADYAIASACLGDVDQAISLLVDAFEQETEGEVHSTVLSATQMICQIFSQTGYPICGLALAKILLAYLPGSDEMAQFLRELIMNAPLPTPVKAIRFNPAAPEEFSAKNDYDMIAPLIVMGCWKQALSELEKLAPLAEQWPNLLMSLALVQLWLHKNDQAYQTLKRYVEMKNLSDEDRADAMAIYFMLDRRHMDDDTRIIAWDVDVLNFDMAFEQLLSTPDIFAVDFDPHMYGDAENPPPKKIFMILDRPFPAEGEMPTIDNTPRQIGTMFIFGRQTDREARLEFIEVMESDQEKIMARIQERIGGYLGKVGESNTLSEPTQTAARIDSRLRFKNSTNPPTKEQLFKLIDDSLVLDGPFWQWWLNHSFKILDNQTPIAAAPNPVYKPKLLGMILVIEYLLPPADALRYCNVVREFLGFEPLQTITLPEQQPEAALSRLPIPRWYRVDTTPLSIDALGNELGMLDLVGEIRGAVHFAKNILERPMVDADYPIRALAFRTLLDDAETRSDFDDALLWIDRAKNEATELKQSLAEWDIAELMVRIKQRNQAEAVRLMDHIMRPQGRPTCDDDDATDRKSVV